MNAALGVLVVTALALAAPATGQPATQPKPATEATAANHAMLQRPR
jgi:hypothetical protein